MSVDSDEMTHVDLISTESWLVLFELSQEHCMIVGARRGQGKIERSCFNCLMYLLG